MFRRNPGLILLAATSLGTLALAASGVAGCQSNSATSSAAGAGSGGNGGDGATTGANAGGAAATGTQSTGTETSTATGPVNCEGPAATIEDITTGVVGSGIKVQMTGLVVMSQKFLVYPNKNTGSCLWGVFVSAPGLATTAEHTGLLVAAYGTMGVTNDAGKLLCPKLGEEPAGDVIPDDVAPGDVLDLTGETSYYVPSTCGDLPGESTIGQFQVVACAAAKNGTAPVPAAAVVDVAELAEQNAVPFHDSWGGVKVRIEGATPVLENGSVVGMYGIMTVDPGLQVRDNIYYRAYSSNKCNDGPIFDDPATVFTAIEGFYYRDYCTWGLEPNDKCHDFDPPSDDCNGALTCPPD